MKQTVYEKSLAYHQVKPYGKLAITATKPMETREDLMLAYSPGVAEPCRHIQADPNAAATLTSRANLVAVITNGTAVLGLGDIGPLAAKPVMEGKAVLFKKFAGLDAFDIEIDEKDPQRFVDIVASLAPTFGGINLEDIKSPECFYIEQELSSRIDIPVFHDDQHGTAIIVCAALLNALELIQKDIKQLRVVCNGAGAAAISCLNLLCTLGIQKQNIILVDSKGVVRQDRQNLDALKGAYATPKDIHTLAEAMDSADMFLGLSVEGCVTAEMVKSMSPNPLIFALANPEPEINPSIIKEVRDDAIIATGRSDFPNQVNNVLCFPFLFRGALDVGAKSISLDMKVAAIKAIARIAKAESSDVVSTAYGGEIHQFGPEYIIPKPFDSRLFVEVSLAVAQAAIDGGIAQRPFESAEAYKTQLEDTIYRSSSVMRTVFKKAKAPTPRPIRLVFSEGESRRVLQAVQMLVDEKMCRPELIGRPEVIQYRMERLGLRFKLGQDVMVTDPNSDERFHTYWSTYHKLTQRRGVTAEIAKLYVRTRPTIIGALMVYLNDADGLICGTIGRYHKHLEYIDNVLGSQASGQRASLSALVIEGKPLFMADTYLNVNPTADELVHIVNMAVEQMRHFGVEPKVALLSHSNFGSSNSESAIKMRAVLQQLLEKNVDFEVDGEMHGDMAFSETLRSRFVSDSRLKGSANLLIMPNVESANIAYNLAKALGGHLGIGPMLLGLNHTAHIVTPSTTTRGVFNMASLAIVEAKEKRGLV